MVKLSNLLPRSKIVIIISVVFVVYIAASVIYFKSLRATIIFQETQLARLLRLSGDSKENNENQKLQKDELNTYISELLKNYNSMVNEIIELRKENNNLLAEFMKLNQITDYSNVQKIIDTSVVSIQQINDYERKINICDNVIKAIDDFMRTSNNMELINVAEIARSGWSSKRYDYRSILDSLIGNLDKKLMEKARSVSTGRHFFSTIEKIDVLDSIREKNNNFLYYKNVYDVRMVGIIGNSSIYKFTITVSGYIDMANDSIGIYDKVLIDE